MMEGQVPVSHSEYVRLVRESNRVPGLEQRIADLEAELDQKRKLVHLFDVGERAKIEQIDKLENLVRNMHAALRLDVVSKIPTTRYYVEQVEQLMSELGIEVSE